VNDGHPPAEAKAEEAASSEAKANEGGEAPKKKGKKKSEEG
jgi:hypothetical protein